MIQFAFFRPDEDKHDLSILGTIFYYLTNLLAVPIAFALIFLTFSITIQVYNNLTSLERLSMRQMRIPCWGPSNEDHSYPNEYDMLWLSNFK